MQCSTVHKGFHMDGAYCVWKTDFLEPGTVHKGEFPNFFDVGVRNVYMGKQLAVVTGMGSKLIVMGQT